MGTEESGFADGDLDLPARPKVTRWREKPVVVEAVEWTGRNAADVKAFTGRSAAGNPLFAVGDGGAAAVWNEQEHGWCPCPAGHSVVRGRFGELYPVSASAIAETYEPAGSGAPSVSVSRPDLDAVLGAAHGRLDPAVFNRLARALGLLP